MFGDILEDLRFGLGVSAEHNRTMQRGIRRAAKKLLRAYNFRESLRKDVQPMGPDVDRITLMPDAGKVKLVVLTTMDGNTRQYKRLLRRPEGLLPYYQGPKFYYSEGFDLVLDTPLPADGLNYELWAWYQSVDPDLNEDWLSSTYEDVLEHLSGTELALKLRKPEAFEYYNRLWMEDVPILARYIAELEFTDMDMGFGDTREVALERYPAS